MHDTCLCVQGKDQSKATTALAKQAPGPTHGLHVCSTHSRVLQRGEMHLHAMHLQGKTVPKCVVAPMAAAAVAAAAGWHVTNTQPLIALHIPCVLPCP
jgi:hypothetical protein